MHRASAPAGASEAGVTLLEVVVALALLGLLCASAFGVFAAGMRASRAATTYTTALLEGERILHDVVANGMDTDMKEGTLDSGYRWKADRVRESTAQTEGPAQLLRWQVSLWWPSSRGEQRIDLVALTMTQNQPVPTDAQWRGAVTPGSQPRGGRP